MASAPTPGAHSASQKRETVAQASLTIKMRGETRILHPGNLPMQLRVQIRAQTGHPLAAWMDEMDLDSVCVLWWVAGVQSGACKRSYSFAEAVEEWPADLTPDELDIVEDDGTPDEEPDPEA